MARSLAKSPFVLFALGFSILVCPASSTEDDHIEQGRYQKEISFAGKAVETAKRIWGPEEPATADTLNDLGNLLRNAGDYAKAEQVYQEALRIRQKVLGSEHPDAAVSLYNLGSLYQATGGYAKAEPLLQEALRIQQKVLGPEHPETAVSLNNLGSLYQATGEYAKAEPLYQEALRIRQKVLGPEHPDTAVSLNNLGSLYQSMHEYAKAEPLHQEALRIRQKVLGSEHPDTANSLNNLGSLYQSMGEYAKAEPLLQEALRIREKVLGPEHPDTAVSLNDLGVLYTKMGRYSQAEPLFQEALQIRKKALGSEHPDTALSLDNLGVVYDNLHEYSKAESFEALRINEKNFGGGHPRTVLYLDNLGYVKFQLGRIEEAKDLAHLKAKAELTLVSKVFSFTTEQQRLAYLNEFDPYDLFVLLNGSEIDLAAAVLRYKGAVLDSVVEDRLVAEASKDLDDRKLIEQLQSTRQQLGGLLLQTAHEESTETNNRIEELEKQAEDTEAKLTQKVSHLGQARRSLHVTIEEVQSALPKNTALVEYLRYWHYITLRQREPYFAAIVLFPKRPPAFVPLGKAQEIETLVRRYQTLVRRSSEDEELSRNLSAIYSSVWEPIEHALPQEITRLIISPDGQLNFLGFSTLLTPDKRFLAEKFIVQYAASGRDLVRDSKPAQNNDVMVFANPDFQLNDSRMLARADNQSLQNGPGRLRGPETRDMEDLSFPALAGTQAECDQLAAKFKGWNWKTTDLSGAAASKEALLNAHSPYILHLATHGFFEQGPKTESKIEPQLANFAATFTASRFFANPMHRSGLALAGAETTLEAWKRGDVPPIETDGIVTAEDISTIDLKDTWLVTLSACDTGSGEARAGEGVLGLRRGFIEAGAQNLLMTLWPISDEFTVQIMSDFYEAAHKSGDAPLALANVQRDWLVRLRKEKGLAQAVNLAGPFIMSSQGKP